MLPDTALQISSAGINTGGVAGMNLLLIFGDTLNALWLGIIGFFLFLTFQYLIFYKLINNINLFFKQDKKVEKKAPSKPLKEVKVPDNIKKERKKHRQNNQLQQSQSVKNKIFWIYWIKTSMNHHQ